MADMIKKDRAEVRTLRITDEVMAKFNTIKADMKALSHSGLSA